MATTMLSVHMDEGGAYFVHIETKDETGAARAPKTLNWTLTDETGQTVINNRKEVPISDPTASEDVVLNGDDCAILPSETASQVKRIFTIKGTYDSDKGTDLNLRGQCYIILDNYPALPISS